jgi:hypothetical protein
MHEITGLDAVFGLDRLGHPDASAPDASELPHCVDTAQSPG